MKNNILTVMKKELTRAFTDKRMLFGTAAMVVVGAVIWWLIHLTTWISPAVEPMWSLVLALVLCISAVGAWTMINMKEG